MEFLICPVCKGALKRKENTYKCENSHSYDISKFGVLNLLMSQASSKKRHGDDKLMINARRDFLDSGYYSPLKSTVCKMLENRLGDNAVIVDTGCGECYYTYDIAKVAKQTNIIGIDISKEALRWGKKRMDSLNESECAFCVASIFDMSIADNSCDLVVNMFAPHDKDEFRRVLKEKGLLLRVFPLENHLVGLKEKIYNTVKLNKIDNILLDGFDIIRKEELKYEIELKNNTDIQNLFKMTPYYYKTSLDDQQKLNNVDELKTQVEFLAVLYQKN